ncbi:MAG TPA: acyl-CoA dehydrogenase family protein [Candidatus Eisenbacteria bacterium]|nr:acyl-CoA dehydrogenase family protein [Candidatus Eisenbacteria bacterium]
MEFQISEEQQLLRQTIRDFATSEISPEVEAYERESRFPRALVNRLWKELGLGGMSCSEEFGGLGLDPISYVLVIEELARVWPAIAIAVSVHNSVGVQLIDRFGSSEQKRRYLPRLTSEWLAAFSLSEPGAGSDVAAIRATARREGDTYIVNGEKNWVTNGQSADIYIVFLKTDPNAGSRGITAFIVERSLPGLSVSKSERKMGIKSSEAVVLSFDEAHVLASCRLGEEGQGFKIAMQQLDGGRIGVGAQAVGIAQAALERSLDYARERHAFGRPISEFQAVQWMLADMATRLEAARLLVYRAAWLRQVGQPYGRAASMAKLHASETATFVTHRAIQIHGGYGYTEDYLVERYYRDARVTEIYEGTSEIQRLVIARNWLKENGFEG